jgi:hypothetical protein
MAETSYLWNWYRTRRHIWEPHVSTSGDRPVLALCGGFYNRREFAEQQIHAMERYGVSLKVIERRLARLDDVPVCKRCLSKLEKS